MEKYDYRRAMIDDIKDWIVSDTDISEEGIVEGRDDDLYDWIQEEIWDGAVITGNDGYYYGTEEFCSECLSENFDLLYNAAHEFALGDGVDTLIKHYEDKSLARYFDCLIRCYLLGECIYVAVDELIKEGKVKYITNQNSEQN